MSAPPLAIVAAIARNGVIGAGGGLPFRLPSDLKRFRALTMGKPMLMGRKTFQSIGRPLPGRETIVVTRSPDFSAPGVLVAATPDDALALGRARAAAMGADEISLIGGAQLYAALLPRTQRLHVTFVDLEPEGDVRFPPLDWPQWRETAREPARQPPGDEAPSSFASFERAEG